jgi:mono/diheme cytochrome c family protein
MMMLKSSLTLFALAALLIGPTACKKDAKTGDKTSAAKIDEAGAQKLYKTLCTSCHGVKGAGDGAASAALKPKPRNFGDAAWQKSVTDQQIKDTISKGGAAVGKSPLMPASPSSPEVLNGLVKIIRGFAK